MTVVIFNSPPEGSFALSFAIEQGNRAMRLPDLSYTVIRKSDSEISSFAAVGRFGALGLVRGQAESSSSIDANRGINILSPGFKRSQSTFGFSLSSARAVRWPRSAKSSRIFS